MTDKKPKINTIFQGDALNVLRTFPDGFVNCCVTSPPYFGLRDYGVNNQIGLEETPEQYMDKLVEVFREVRRVLRKDGTLWLNLGDSYNGGGRGGRYDCEGYIQSTNKGTHTMPAYNIDKNSKPKDLIGIPWMVAFALRKDGWYLRQDIIWSKRNPMPESVKDRCTKAHEYIFLLSKSQKYYYNQEAIKEISYTKSSNGPIRNNKRVQLGRDIGGFQTKGFISNGFANKRSVWEVSTHPEPEAHFAVFPQKLIIPCIKAGCPKAGIVLDPFIGSGTTGIVARKQDKNYIGIELNPDYIKIAEKRLYKELGMFK